MSSMKNLFELIQQKTTGWRKSGYLCDEFPSIAEILEYARIPNGNSLRFLRKAQIRALETYWYLRLVEGTPHIFSLYQKYYPKPLDLLSALGLDRDEIKDFVLNNGIDLLWDHIRTNDDFVKQHKLESVRETLSLEYPSYIFALAMGAGKTILIGAIIAAEFAMALEYHPDTSGPFIQNALAFAPGLTILESLRELAEVPYSEILPPRLYKPFEATYKLIFTREGEKDLPVIRGSRYNLIVTNTEKIRIQKRTYKHHSWSDLYAKHMLEQYEAEANLRLRAIASLPNLGIFSDEAHHTYGQDVGEQLKRVRQTVDYLHSNTDLICVVNTTGTPYYQRQILRDVVIWYGLSEGIRDDILKSLEGNIFAYDFDQKQTDRFVSEVVRDFIETYGDVSLPNGAPAKLAIYFPQTKDLRDLRPVIEQALMQMGYPTDIVLRNTSKSTQAEIDAFNRLNDPRSQHRIILLVNKGTEGWDCQSLFACALARKLKRSQNFVLQASTRCLRQVPGNPHKARIYLSMENRGTLDRQLQETYGETVDDLSRAGQDTRNERLVVRKLEIPPIVIRKLIRCIIPDNNKNQDTLQIKLPKSKPEHILVKRVYTPEQRVGQSGVLTQVDEEKDTYEVAGSDLYTVATRLAAIYRVKVGSIYAELKRLYGVSATVPDVHVDELATQIEKQLCSYRVIEEEIEVALALIKPDGFEREESNDGNIVYTTQITYQKGKEHLLLSWREMAKGNPRDFGFHYDPYNFDSNPEKNFFIQMLRTINVNPKNVDDIYFTGGLHDPQKTDFYIEYQGTDGKAHSYSPDFVIRCKNGRSLIVEIKAERFREDPVDGEKGRKAMAVQQWVGLNPDRLKYEIIFTSSNTIPFNKVGQAKNLIKEDCKGE